MSDDWEERWATGIRLFRDAVLIVVGAAIVILQALASARDRSEALLAAGLGALGLPAFLRKDEKNGKDGDG